MYIKWENTPQNEGKSALDYLNEEQNKGFLQFDAVPRVEEVVKGYEFVIASRNHISHAGNSRYNRSLDQKLATMTEYTIHDSLSEIRNFDTYNSLTPNWYYKVLR
jgi:hypothetical protein